MYLLEVNDWRIVPLEASEREMYPLEVNDWRIVPLEASGEGGEMTQTGQ